MRLFAVWALAVAVETGIPGTASAASVEAKVIFRKRCMACHTFGKGIKVGPDLKGVTDRRKRDWLLNFIRSSSAVIQSGDPVAGRLFVEFKRERMPDWSDLSPDEIQGIIDYFASNGPEQKEPDERHASSASVAEIEAGRQLFGGEKVLTYGGAACDTCHSLDKTAKLGNHKLGPDLSDVYLRFQDKALTDFLKRPCVLREPEMSTGRYLTPQESFELKAYLAKTATLAAPAALRTAPASLNDKNGENALPAITSTASSARSRFLFEVWPYVALAGFVAGALARCAFPRKRTECELTHARVFWGGSRYWLLSLLVLILRHLAGILFPRQLLLWDASPALLDCLEGAALAAGVGALGGWACMTWRLVGRPFGSIGSQLADTIFLSLLFAVLASGLAAAVLYRWSSSWGALIIAPYTVSVLQGRPISGLMEEMPFLLRFHISCALALAPLLPFTSATPLFVHAVRHRTAFVVAPIFGAVQSARATLALWMAKHGPAAWIWPEED